MTDTNNAPLYGAYNPDADKQYADDQAEDSVFLNMKDEGEYVLRFIPPLSMWADFFAAQGRSLSPFFFWWRVNFETEGVGAEKNRISYPSPEKNNYPGMRAYPDPTIARAKELKETGDPMDFELGGELEPSLRVSCNVINRDDEKAGPKIWEFGAPRGKKRGKSVWEKIETRLTGRNRRELIDPISAFDIVVIKTGSGRTGTNYEIDVVPDRSPLSHDREQLEHWIRSQHDLRQYVKPPTMEQLSQILCGEAYYSAGRLSPKRDSRGQIVGAGGGGGQRSLSQGRQNSALPAAPPPRRDLGTVIDSYAKDAGGGAASSNDDIPEF
jgi:hypothetical protein